MRGSTVSENAASSPTLSVAGLSRVTRRPCGCQACALNAPWAWCGHRPTFGRFSGALLVGNFGDSRINACNFRTGQWLGNLRRHPR